MAGNRRHASTCARAIGLSVVSCGVCCQSTAAQEPDADDDSVDEIVVTGSRIARRDLSSPSPTVSLDAMDFRLAGATTAEELLNTLPQFIPASGRATNDASGIAAINLRGLGTERTLVMLNGRRFAASEISGAVDINNIPPALIDRVEVVTGGASAAYGSDAVVGVVNFVLDDEFDGIAINAQYEVTQEGDGEILDLSISAGMPFDGGRGHVSGFLNFNERRSISGGDREFTSVVIDDDRSTGELVEVGSNAVPEGAILFPETIIDGVPVNGVLFNRDGTLRPADFPEELYNYAPANYLQVPLERYVGAAFAKFDFTPELHGTFEALYAQNKVASQFAPTPVSFFDAVTIDSPFLPAPTRQILRDSFDPDGDGLAEFFMRRRMSEVEPRQFEDTRDVVRLLAGLDGKLTDEWEWDSYYSYTDTDVEPRVLNVLSLDRFLQSLLLDSATGGCLDPSGGCVPANIYGAGNVSAEAVEFMRFGTIENEKRVTEQVASVAFTGRLRHLPAGPVGVAVGMEWRRLKGVFSPDPAFANGDVIGARGFQPAIGATEVNEIFGELLVPLLLNRPFAEYLAIEAGARSSDYNTAGRVTTWKLGSEWAPTEDMRFRVMYQTAIRAPSVLEMFELPRQVFLDRFNAETDLCSASRDPVGNGLAEVCIAQGLDPAVLGVFEAPDPNFVLFYIGGNPDLEPEDSTSITAGVVIQPGDNDALSVSIDYFDIKIEDAILDIQAGALASCFAIKDPNSHLCQGYVRDASGAIAEANNYPRNVARQRSEGVDLQLLYSFNADALALFDGIARFDMSINGTWYLRNGSQSSPITPFHNCAGYFGPSCAFSNFGTLPEFKTMSRLTYSSGPLRASLNWRWIDGMRNSTPFFTELFGQPDPVLAIPKTSSKSYVDLSGTYDVTESIQLYGGIVNMFNADPPLLAGAAPGLNTDTATFDTIGRRFFLGVHFTM